MSNVHRLPVPARDPSAEALTEARAIPAGHLDRILADEQRNLPALDKGAHIVDELAAVGRAVWLRRDAEARAEQATRWAVRLEQQLAEIDRLAAKWSGWQGLPGGIGRTLLDITRGDRDDDDHGPATA